MSESVTGPPDGPASARIDLVWFVRLGITAIAVVIALHILARIQGVLLVVGASLVIALGVQPYIRSLTERGMSRGWATTALLMAAFVVGGSVLALGLPLLIEQVGTISDQAPAIIDDLRSRSDLIDSVVGRFDPMSLADGRTLGSAAGVMFDAITVAILAPYFAYSLPRIKLHVLRLLHREDRQEFTELLDEAIERVSGFIAGNIVVSLFAAGMSFVALLIIGVPYPAALAMWIGLTDLIPVVGVFIGALPAVAVALVENSPATAVAVAIFIIAYQQVENYLLAPRVMQRTVDLSPPTVIVALMVGGSVAGVLGALLALPVAAVLSLLMDEFVFEARARKVALGIRPNGNRQRPSTRRRRLP